MPVTLSAEALAGQQRDAGLLEQPVGQSLRVRSAPPETSGNA